MNCRGKKGGKHRNFTNIVRKDFGEKLVSGVRLSTGKRIPSLGGWVKIYIQFLKLGENVQRRVLR